MKKNCFQPLGLLFMLFLIPLFTYAQNVTVTGNVKDVTGEVLIGATVLEEGTQNGTITDANGDFSLNVSSKGKLVISFIGYESQTVTLNGNTNFNIVLQDDAKSLDEVVVIGYGVQRKSDLTGAVASVDADEIKSLATSDAAAALQGKAAGVQILNTSGAPGTGAQIRIRGYSSNSGNLGPLLIVDGLKVDNIQYLDPSMIESIEILKDAASAAIYGAEAGNGVVLVTTKTGNGMDGSPKITYSFKAINQSLGRTPELFGAKDWIRYKELSGFDMVTLTKANGVDYDNPQNTDWVKEVFGNSWATQHSLTFQDGNDKGHFFASLNYVNNDGIVRGKKDVYTRYTGQLNADYKLYSWIKVGTNTSIEKWFIRSVTQSSAYGSMLAPALMLDPLTPVYFDSIDDFTTDMKTQWNTNPSTILRAPNGKYYATSKFYKDDNGNPLLQRDRRDATNGGYTVRGTAYIDFTPIEGFVYTSRVSYRLSQNNSHEYASPYYLNGQANATDYSINATANNGQYLQWENFANFNKSFDKHNVGAMVGMSYIENRWDNVTAGATGTGGNKILSGDAANFRYVDYVNSASTTTKNIGNAPGNATSISYFGRLIYNYDNRYSVQFNYRADAFDTSKLPANKRWGKFPSVSAGWTISNEKFFKDNVNSDVLSFAKIRASWGRNGNINVLSGYPYQSPINYNAAWYQYGNDATLNYGSYPNGYANPNLTWETSEQIDLGLDMRFLNDRLTVGIDYYNKTTKDLLVTNVPLSPEVTTQSYVDNAGKINNQGLEVELNWRDRIGDLRYSVAGNFSTLKNEVTYLNKDMPRIPAAQGGVDGTNNKVSTAFEKGHAIWYFRAYDYAGVDKETGAPLFRNKEGNIVSSSELSDEDLTDIGSAIPKLTYGITINLEYKNFDFSVFGTGVAGNKIFNILYRADSPMRNSLKYYMDNAWTGPGSGKSMPDPAKVATDNNFWSSSASMFNGAYFKFKQIQLGYTLPKELTEKVAVKNLRVFVSLDDFFTISKYPGMDPETATTSNNGGAGFDIGTFPTMKKFTFGASIAF
ncbi:MAG: TonB-dependent receptor [Culturomica sp.]|nr:TonB-dependent receptor [Culturomica sp.]